jgi:DNA-binding LacI/PurR family transcriptional regulator
LKLLSSKTRPTAVVAANDMMAFGLVEAARELKLDVPRQISIVGFDDLSSSGERDPMITTVHQPVVEMAARAARLLVHSLETGHKPDQRIVLPVHLVRRASTAPPCP